MSDLRLEVDGAVATITIDRPDRLGALSRAMVAELGDLLRDVRGRDDLHVLVLTGTGRGFVAGADIEEYHGVSAADFDSYQRLSRVTFTELAQLPQATIVAVNGYALGGGFELALCCDLIVASDRARFGLPEVTLGLIPGGGGTQRLARAVGVARAKELIMTGRIIRADEADRLGLLIDVVPDDELPDRTRELARQLATRAPLAVRAAKEVVEAGTGADLATGLDLEQAALRRLYATADAAEGIDAFMAKRDPDFRGR